MKGSRDDNRISEVANTLYFRIDALVTIGVGGMQWLTEIDDMQLGL